MDSRAARQLFNDFAPSVAYVAVEHPNGDQGIGSAFHVGEGVFVTARHLVEETMIREVGITETMYVRLEGAEAETSRMFVDGQPAHEVRNTTLQIAMGPFVHQDPRVDVAVFKVAQIDPHTPAVPLGGHLDDWLGESDFVLFEGIILGYPPIPMTTRPSLIAARAEVAGVIDLWNSPHVHFVLSAMPRGGFSGGVAILEGGFALGMITQSLLQDDLPTELGHLAVIGVEPIYQCLADHNLLPDCQAEMWDGLWNTTTLIFAYPRYRSTRSDVPTVVDAQLDVFDDGKRFAVTVMINRDAVLFEKTMTVLQQQMIGLNPMRSAIRARMERIEVTAGDPHVRERFDHALQAAIATIEGAGLQRLDSEYNTITPGVGDELDPFTRALTEPLDNPPTD
jgi:hypothetical protein